MADSESINEFSDDEDTAVENRESACQRNAVKCCGSVFFVFVGLVAVSWAFHAFEVGSEEAPKFARSLIWLSIAHHTDYYNEQMAEPPPPPSFGDGKGNF